MNCSQCLLILPSMPADHCAECFQDITLFNSQNNHMTLESVGGTAGAWGMGTGIQTHISQDLGLCSAASPRADLVLGQQQIS